MLNFASDKLIKNMTTPISDNFETRIINELMLAQQSIKIAVAWFNSQNILNVLCWKLKGGIKVELIMHYDEINTGSDYSLDFTEYKRLGGILIWAKNEKSTMHVKFCIIDDKVLLHGSCNWTYRAFKKNDEVLNVTKDETEMTNSYISNFASLQEKYTTSATTLKIRGYASQTKKKNGSTSEIPYQNLNNTASVEEGKLLFLKTLQPFESKYDKDYIRTFIDYWLSENNGKLRFEYGDNGMPMNMLGITPEYMEIKLEHWKEKYDIIVTERQSEFLLDEIWKEVKLVEKDYERRGIELQCNTAMDDRYGCTVGHRLFEKLLFDRGFFVKRYEEHDFFMEKKLTVRLCYPIDTIKEKEEIAFSNFCLLYEANQAFKRIKEYNNAILLSIDSKNTYKSFCDQYGIYYGHSLKKDKSIKEMIDSLDFPIQLKYHVGSINVSLQQTPNPKRLLKLNEIFGLQLLTTQCGISTFIIVPHKVLYAMDGMQFDFRDDSFENGTMKFIKLPKEYKDASFYVEKIEEMLTRR